MTQAWILAAPLALGALLGAFARGRFTGPLGWCAGALLLLVVLLLALPER